MSFGVIPSRSKSLSDTLLRPNIKKYHTHNLEEINLDREENKCGSLVISDLGLRREEGFDVIMGDVFNGISSLRNTVNFLNVLA